MAFRHDQRLLENLLKLKLAYLGSFVADAGPIRVGLRDFVLRIRIFRMVCPNL